MKLKSFYNNNVQLILSSVCDMLQYAYFTILLNTYSIEIYSYKMCCSVSTDCDNSSDKYVCSLNLQISYKVCAMLTVN